MPNSEYIVQQRLGYRVPRSMLLPPYLNLSPYYKEFTDAIDHVWKTQVDQKIDVIKNIRNPWVTNPTIEQKVIDETMISFDDWSRPERDILVKQVNLLGMKLKSAGLLTDMNYLTISRYLGRYWFGKGTEAFIEFINFALVLDLEVYNLWSTVNEDPSSDVRNHQYNNFTRENADGTPPGTPIWEGGTWFPTTHVEVVAKGGLQNIDVNTLVEFFYEIANYNLVIAALDNAYDIPVVDTLEQGRSSLAVVGVGLYFDPNVVISTEGRYGAAPPLVQQINGVPTTVLGSTDQDTMVILGVPSSWFADPDGRRFPVYDRNSQVTQNDVWLPTHVACNVVGADLNDYPLLSTPTTWVSVPGASRSGGRIPGYGAVPTESVQPQGMMTTRVISRRDYILSRPDGWAVIAGAYCPYWN